MACPGNSVNVQRFHKAPIIINVFVIYVTLFLGNLALPYVLMCIVLELE